MTGWRLLVLLSVLAVAAAGCGGEQRLSTDTSAHVTTLAQQAARPVQQAPRIVPKTPRVQPAAAKSRAAFAGCMGAAGYSGRSVTVTARYTATFNTCRKLLPNNGEVPASQRKKLETGTKQFAECMRANGVASFPNPVVTKFGAAIRIPANYDSPQYRSAAKTCEGILYLLRGASPPA